MRNVGCRSRRFEGRLVVVRARVGAVALMMMGAAVSFAMAVPSEARAEGSSDEYVECRWQPFQAAWACTLPSTFTQGRFGPPPEFKHDAVAEALRQQAYAAAKAAPGARARGRVGVFVPRPDGAWLFVPGNTWSPGEPVFLPPPPKPAP